MNHRDISNSSPPSESDALAQKVVDLSRLTGGLAHEIRNPLSTLKMNLQLLDEDWRHIEFPDGQELDPRDVARRSRKRLATLLTETQRLESILEDFLQFVRRRELHRVVCDLNELVTTVGDFYRPQTEVRGIDLQIVPHPSPVLCDIDVNLTKQALLNLLINAQQAMPDGGMLIISTGVDTNGFGRIDVADTGPGIPADEQQRVFEAYFSTKKGGTGLGLATTQQIIDAHNGRITVHSTPPHGATFTILLPLSK